MKKISVIWALLVGLLSVAVEVLAFYIRLGQWNVIAGLLDYVLFFIGGTLGGWILIAFLNGQTSSVGRLIVLIVFLLASPLALILMLGGGVTGWIGVIVFPLVPWALFTWVGSLAGKMVK